MSPFIVREGASKPSVAPGTYPARCFRIVDLGTQHSEYGGKEIVKRQLLISWELPNELITEGDWAGMPKAMHKFYSRTLHEKSVLRHDIENWRGRPFTSEELTGFDLGSIVGKPCLITVVTAESGKSKVGAVTALPKEMDVPDAVNSPMVFHIDDDCDWSLLEELPEWVTDIIARSDEYRAKDKATEESPDVPVANEKGLPF